MTRILTIIALLFATPVVAFSPDDVVIACPTEHEGRDVYIYKKYVMFEAGISWPYNEDTSHSVEAQVGDYFGWSTAIYEDGTKLKDLAAGKGVLRRTIARLEKTTSIDFRSFTRDVNFRFLDDNLKLVSEVAATTDCEDITPR